MAAPHANHDAFMRRAIELSAQGGIKEMTGGCFGAIVVETATGEIVGEGYNKVIKESDPTWHGEMEALRAACKKKGAPHLPGCVVYTSAQPCPMCYTACMWARVDHVYYAATYEDVLQYGKFEDSDFLGQLRLPEDQRDIKCSVLMREEAVEVWRQYAALPNTVHY
ncbi:Guanine deaminase [Chlorella vulgaris]